MANSTVCSAVIRSVMRHLLRRLRVRWRGFAISLVMCIFSIMVVSGAVSKGTPPQVILCPSHTNGTKVRGLDMPFRSSPSDIFRVAHTYSVPSHSFQHCHRARCILPTTPFLNLALGVIIASESSTAVPFLFSVMCWDLAPGRVNGSTSPLIHRQVERYFSGMKQIQRCQLPMVKLHHHAFFRVALASSKVFHACIML